MPVGKHPGQRAKENLKAAPAYAKMVELKLREEVGVERPFTADDQTVDYALFRASHASAALTLNDHEIDTAIAKAFSEAGLDPENPWHWRALLHAFAEAYYPAPNSNQFWTAARLTELLGENLRLATQYPKWKKEQRNKQLIKWIADRYGKHIKVSTLPRLLRQAKDRKTNKFLDSIYQEVKRDSTETLSKYLDQDSVAKVLSNSSTTMEFAIALDNLCLGYARRNFAKTKG